VTVQPPSVEVGDIAEIKMGRQSSKTDLGEVNIATRVRERKDAKEASCRWDPPNERLWMRVLYCDWMRGEGWTHKKGLHETWLKRAPRDTLELAALKRMFRLGLRAGKVAFRPEFPSLEVHNTRTGFFEEAELQAVLAELPDHVRPLVQFLALTGWRVSEACSLRWTQVDHVGGVVRLEVGSTKSGAGRIFPFAALPVLATLMRTQRERTSALERERGVLCPWVFHRNGKPIQSFRDAWLGACERAGVPGRLVHDLRRSAARSLVRSSLSARRWRCSVTRRGASSIATTSSASRISRTGSGSWRHSADHARAPRGDEDGGP